jgi:hypothetical protein
VVYLSFWIQCPQPLNEIMADPNVPEVDLKFSASGSSKIWLNGREQFVSSQAVKDAKVEKLPLIKGWNHFIVKLVRPTGDWSFSARLLSKDFKLLSSFNSALNPHSARANFYTVNFTDPEINYDSAWNLNGDGWYQSFTSGSRAKFKFYGTGLGLSGKVGPDGGTAKLYIDGTMQQIIDYRRDVANPHAPIYSKSDLRNGEHEVMIEVIEGRVTLGNYDQWERY